MYTDIILKPVYDGEAYTSPDGTQYPYNYPKDEIKDLILVTETEKPTDENLVVIDFSINENYTQVWNTRKKTDDEKVTEKDDVAAKALQEAKDNRLAGYGTVNEQLTMMAADFNGWITHRQAVDQQYPLPE